MNFNKKNNHTDLNQSGFSLVELLTAMIISTIILVAFTTFFIDYYQNLLLANRRITKTSESDLSTLIIQNEIKRAENVLTFDPTSSASTHELYDPNRPSGGWILGEYAGTGVKAQIIITTFSLDSNSSPIINPATNYPYLDVIIYYAENNKLKRRVVANANATGNIIKDSCPITVGTCKEDQNIFEDSLQSTKILKVNRSGPMLSDMIVTLNFNYQSFGKDIKILKIIMASPRNISL
jgi:prepilin-type N-terminal cleavage/methylation domain-containing protein